MKFKKGDRVRVIRRSIPGEMYWHPLMDKAIGKVYTVLEIKGYNGNLRLDSESDTMSNWLYPPKSVTKININRQLLFPFMDKLRLSK